MSHYYAGLDTRAKLVADMEGQSVDTSVLPTEKNYVQAAPEHHVDEDAYSCFYMDLVEMAVIVQYFEKVSDDTIESI